MTIDRLRAHWGFTRMPFAKDLAPSMLFSHRSHAEAVARVTWCIDEVVMGVVTGEVGSGKTVAVRAALAGIDASRHSVIYLGNPTVGARGLYSTIVSVLGGTPRFHRASLIPQAQEALSLEEHERGRRVVVVLDEAHLLDAEQLEGLRLLTNAELDSRSPFSCLLVGQPTLRRRIRLGAFAALDQRVALRYSLTGMELTETAGYVAHHLKIALLTELPTKYHLVVGVPCGRVPVHGQRGEPCRRSGIVCAPTGWGAQGDRRPVGAVPAA